MQATTNFLNPTLLTRHTLKNVCYLSPKLKEEISNKTDNILSGKIVPRSRNHCCSGKATNIEYHECVSAALHRLSGMQIASVLLSIILPICLYNILTLYLINGTI
jgi:Fe-S oxidoreductase